MDYIESICISEKKGTVKKEVDEALFLEDWGIRGDAHAGNWHRQVSLLAGESVDMIKAKMPELNPGSFAENIQTRGFDLTTLMIGDRIRLGDGIILEITQIGKQCHNACEIRKKTGDCIMPREGIFTRVIEGGYVRPGDRVEKY